MSTGKSSRLVSILWAATFALAFGQLARPAAASGQPRCRARRKRRMRAPPQRHRHRLSKAWTSKYRTIATTRDARQWRSRDSEREQESASANRKSANASRNALKRKKNEQDRAERQEEHYDDGREALDDGKYEHAREMFAELAKENGPQTDAALYWEAYAEQRLGQRQAALASIADLKKRFPQSRWQKDAGALEIEIRQNSGQPSSPKRKTTKSSKCWPSRA